MTAFRLRIAILLATVAMMAATCVAYPAAAEQRDTPQVVDPGSRYRRPSGGLSQPGETSRYRRPSGGVSEVYLVPATPGPGPTATPCSSHSSNTASRRRR